LRGKFHPEILTGSPERGLKKWGGKTSHFLTLNVNISKTVGNTINDYKVTIKVTIKNAKNIVYHTS